MYIENFGEEIKKERLNWGMSVKRLSKLSHVDEEDIKDIESGVNNNPDFFMVLNICDALEISIYSYLKNKSKI